MKSLYSIYDSFLDEFLPPFVAKNDNMAIFSYEEFLKNKPLYKNQITKIFNIGSFDENKGLIECIIVPKCIKVFECKKDLENGKDV